jgi:hypothetical protein
MCEVRLRFCLCEGWRTDSRAANQCHKCLREEGCNYCSFFSKVLEISHNSFLRTAYTLSSHELSVKLDYNLSTEFLVHKDGIG